MIKSTTKKKNPHYMTKNERVWKMCLRKLNKLSVTIFFFLIFLLSGKILLHGIAFFMESFHVFHKNSNLSSSKRKLLKLNQHEKKNITLKNRVCTSNPMAWQTRIPNNIKTIEIFDSFFISWSQSRVTRYQPDEKIPRT